MRKILKVFAYKIVDERLKGKRKLCAALSHILIDFVYLQCLCTQSYTVHNSLFFDYTFITNVIYL